MKPTDDLFRLVHSLSKHEKRYFKLFAARYESKEKNNYIKLFDAIDRQEAYDEEQIKQLFRHEVFVRHLPSEKNYLYNLILDSLHVFYGEVAEQKLAKRLHQANILFARGLFEQSEKILKRIKQQAEQQELYPLLLDILQLEKQIISRNYYSGTTAEELKAIYEQENHCLERIKEVNEYWYLFSRFYHFHYSRGTARDTRQWEQIQEIIHHPLLADVDRKRSYRTQLDFLHIHALYNFMEGNHEKAYHFNRAYLELLESRPEQLQQYSKRYMATLNNSLMDALNLKRYDELKQGIQKLRLLPEKYAFYNSRNTEADIFRLSSILELNQFIKTANYTEGISFIKPIEKGLKEFEGLIVKHNYLTIYYLIAYLYFGAGQYSQAIRWLNRIINDTEEDILQDIHAFARIFALIIHYQLKNNDILDHLFNSTQRYLTKREQVYKAETILLRHLRKMTEITGSRALKEAFVRLKEELQPLASDPIESKAFSYFDLMSWLDSNISGRPFVDIVREKELLLQSN
jgi:hypothetical protein